MLHKTAVVLSREFFEIAVKLECLSDCPQIFLGQAIAQYQTSMSFKQQQATHQLAGCSLQEIFQRRLVSSGRSATRRIRGAHGIAIACRGGNSNGNRGGNGNTRGNRARAQARQCGSFALTGSNASCRSTTSFCSLRLRVSISRRCRQSQCQTKCSQCLFNDHCRGPPIINTSES